jgi:vancomycin resistance protein YoaR
MDTIKGSPARNVHTLQPPPPRPAQRSWIWPWLIRLPLLGATAVFLLIFLAMIFVALHQMQYDGLIFPGVSAYGVKLSGMTKDQALAALQERYTYGTNAVFTFRDRDKAWRMTAQELGVQFDPQQTVEEAYKIGRGADFVSNLAAQAEAWTNGRSLQPVVVFDQSKAQSFLEKIGAEINKPVMDATISLNKTVVKTTPSQIGRDLDIPATLGLLRPVVLNMGTGGEINLIVRETPPAIVDAEAAAAKLRAAVSAPIQIYIDSAGEKDPGPWQVSQEFIGGMISIVRTEDGDGKAHYEVTANTEPLRNFLKGLAPQLTVEPVAARFLFNESTQELQLISESVDGRSLNIDTTMKLIQDTVFKPNDRRVGLVFQKDIPKVNSKSKAAELGIKEQIVQATTFFYGSTANRRTNIQVAASKFHGLVLAPGEEFSFNKYLGDVSPETGYETGLVIYGNQTIRGVGGGVCQVSSTVFQAAFYAGFPIKERFAHGYRVGYYESGTAIANGIKYNSGVGLDATVYAPIIDFKFVNDSPYFLLMTSTYRPNEQSLTFRFYSTNTGRVVTKEGPTLSNYVPHGPPKYSETADLKPGQSRQIDGPVDGVDAKVYRTVKINGQTVINREEFYSHYLPWSAQIQVAPGQAPRSRN